MVDPTEEDLTIVTPLAQAAVKRPLDALNFLLADVRDGLGPYLAIYLLAVRGPDQGWNEGTIGLVMTTAGLVGLLAQVPAGLLIDHTRHKLVVIGVAAAAVTVACLALPFVSHFGVVLATQSLAAAAGAVFPPALAAITLGMVGPRLFARRIGRNEAFNHLGNAVSAAIAGATAYAFGPVVVFWLMAALALLSIGTLLLIPRGAIDDDLARGLAPGQGAAERAGAAREARASAWAVLFGNRRLLLLAALCALFHLANAAMLPTVGQLLTHVVGKEQATSLIAACIVAAQCVMVPVALAVGARVDRWGRKPFFLIAFGMLALRGVLYVVSNDPFWLLAVQMLDGVGAGIFGALFPVILADLTRGTGHFNAAQGAVATVQGIGAALSASLAGFVILALGYSAAFLTLAGIAAVGFLLYLTAMPETRPDSA